MNNIRYDDLPGFWQMCEQARQKQEQKKQTAEFRTSKRDTEGKASNKKGTSCRKQAGINRNRGSLCQ